MASVESTKYLGDIINIKGTNKDLIDDRIKRGKAIIISTLSICNTVTLGCHYIKTSMLMYKAVFLSTVLFNSQAWSNITNGEFLSLRTVQLNFLKRIMRAPTSTANAFTFLGLGIPPIKYEIHKRQLLFLRHILTLPPDDPVLRIYNQQKQYGYEKNWANSIHTILQEYSLSSVMTTKMTKEKWKETVNTAIKKSF